MKQNHHISPFSIILAFVCLSLVGLALLPRLSVKLSPSQTLPQVFVGFNMSGSSPRIVELEATSKLESMLNRINGVKKISSYSGNGWGHIYISFDKHVNIDMARFEVSSVIRQTWPLLPQQVSYPNISVSRADHEASKPFMTYTVNAPASPIAIQQFTEKQIKPRLAQLPGIYQIEVSGATPMEWQLMYDYKQLENLGITTQSIQKAINEYLQKDFFGISAIKPMRGETEWIRVVLVPEQHDDKPDFDKVAVKNTDGKLIALTELVQINRVESEPQSYYRINGLNSIYLSITASDDANQLELSKSVKKELERIKSTFPTEYELHLSYDATEYIQQELSKIYLRTGLTLAILLLFVVLIYRNVRHILLLFISLFINLSIAVIFYYLFNLEIQLYSLAGITISLTLIIDNTIVMSDQIIHRKNKQAFLAILAATTTTIASLSVIFFLEEKLRLNLQDFAYVIIINLAVSLAVALFLVPAIIEKTTRKAPKPPKGASLGAAKSSSVPSTKLLKNAPKSKILTSLKAPLGGLGALWGFVYRWKIIVIILLILAFGLPVFLLPEKLDGDGRWENLYNETLGSTHYKEKIKPHVDVALGGTLRLFIQKVYDGSYFANREETSLYVTATLPSNSTLEQMNMLIQRMENFISQYSEVKQFQTTIHNARKSEITIHFMKTHQKSSFPHLLKSQLISKSLELGGGSWSVYGLGDGFSNDVRESAGSYQVEMFGFNYDELMHQAALFKNKLLEHRRIKEVTINSKFSWFKDEYEEFYFDLDKERIAQEQAEPYQLYASLKRAFGKDIYAGQIPVESGVEHIFLNSKQAKEYNLWDLHEIPLKLNEREYKLSDLATIEKLQAPQEIAKENQQYKLCLQYEYIGATEQGRKVLSNNIEEFEKLLPMGYTMKNVEHNYWGSKDNSQYKLLLLIFVIIYFISSILFNSLKQPFAILFIIPVSFIGIFLAFYLFDLNFDQGGFASFILLSGLTINANIYIIDEYNNVRRKFPQLSQMNAYLKAWNAKIRPIVLTVVSTILGFIPFLIGEHKEAFWFPLAVGTIGGLVVSFLATFLFLPLFMGVGKKLKGES